MEGAPENRGVLSLEAIRITETELKASPLTPGFLDVLNHLSFLLKTSFLHMAGTDGPEGSQVLKSVTVCKEGGCASPPSPPAAPEETGALCHREAGG